MLSRDQVLHVARLARLQLTDEELERFGGELSKVVDWIDKIGELGDLEGVEPTLHVIAGENRLRADEALASLPRAAALGRRRRHPAAGGRAAAEPAARRRAGVRAVHGRRGLRRAEPGCRIGDG